MKSLFDAFPILETERLKLRKITVDDKENVFAYFSDDLVTRYFGIDNFTKIEQAEEIINAFNNGFEQKQAIRWGIALKHTDELIGSIGFHNISKNNARVEVGYEITRKEWNKGYATEALKAVIAYLFNEVGFNRIGATIRPENEASQQLVKKLGFQEEGTLQDYQFTRGNYHDLIMFSLLKRNYK
ncbi:GNAT family N-acetyltransferase [Bacillus suaedaesalsae]|uniref:GNAT family N-acetyltransferase n=1 Tax=Bacillus suaedaesalsae TaxID=2810349 RepID=A0ABS2DM90_9BACI|nr:GNAT family N-acetyltransferase [Bacillus suaedaesalsae]MBM6619589.1 GNAT family N-acetyltransferase [Bacillus suaedaesalsae]